ncbi:MAG: hypothetical protein HOP17_00430 [Acidobacteria bacterium]|nr:hypothetical protein [Acidobacteriota bacterium]
MEGTQSKYFYKAYGLGIHSDFALSDLVLSQSGATDVRIRLGKLDESFLQAKLNGGITRSGYGATARASAEAVAFHWHGIGTAFVRGGRDVIVEPAEGIDERDLSPYINGSILAVLLHQRGLMVLHASAVVLNGQAVAFLGDKGAGKSTFAAFLQNRGHTLLTDDLVPVKFTDDRAFAVPGFPRIRLWADSVTSIGVDPQTLPTINSLVNKHSYGCPDRFSEDPVEINRLYVLAEDEEINIQKLDPKESFIEIVRNCYLSRYTDATGQTVSHFGNCVALAGSVPVFRLTRPHDFTALPDVSSMVENHL